MGLIEKNIICLREKNKRLANRLLLELPNEDFELVQENNFFNLKYKDFFLHNPINPIAEAQEIFSMAENSPVSIHLIFGLGLGYLFQYFCTKSNGTVILYEPNLKLLRKSFSLVDFTDFFSLPNVYVAEDLETLSQIIHTKSSTKNIPQMLSLPSQRELYKDEFDILVEKLQEIIASFYLDLKYTKEKFYSSLLLLIENIPQLIEEKPLALFKDSYKGKTAIVVSAGPTLDRDIEIIKKYRDNIAVFSVGTALKTLIKNGITPDFVSIIESFDSSKQLLDIDCSEINFITEPYSHPNLRKFNFKNIFSHVSANTPINHLWSEIAGVDIKEYWSKGTVSYTALNCARLLGFSKIILVGQDLAYIEGQCYSKDSCYKNLSCRKNIETDTWEITADNMDEFANLLSNDPDREKRLQVAKERLNNLNSSLMYVKGINGDMIPTESVYSAFIKPLREYTEYFKDREFINSSLLGAQIDGFKNIDLETALKDSTRLDKLELNSAYRYNIKNIKYNLKLKINKLEEAKRITQEGLDSHSILQKELNKSKTINADLLKAFKALTLNYCALALDFSNYSKIFEFMMTSEKIDLDYEMKMAKEVNFEVIKNMTEKINNYLLIANYRIHKIIDLLKIAIDKLEDNEQ